MRKTIFWAGLALWALVSITGCNKVRKCTRGDQGCVGGPTNDDGTCEAGLQAKGGKCVEASGGNGGGKCGCAGDEVCAEDGKTCIAYCAPADDLPQVVDTPPSCKPIRTSSNQTPTPFTFRELCIKTCQQTCLRAQVFCPGHSCKPSDCDNAMVLARCAMECPMADVTCLQNKCLAIESASCEGFTCPGTSTRNCTDVRCSDTCAKENIGDGFCDDGDPASATYSFCSYGTDCSDCGPRKGPRPARAALGEVCPGGQDVACEGYNDDFLKSKAWCLRVIDDPSEPFRCVPNCTTPDGAGACPDDRAYSCEPVLNSKGEPFTDAVNGTAGYSCQPLVCE